MDIRVVQGDHNQVSVFTNSGVQLVGVRGGAALVQCAGHGHAVDAVERRSDQEHSRHAVARCRRAAATVDLIANNSIRSGKIAAYLDMRDNVLVQAQNQLDSLAATMAQALSDVTVAGHRGAARRRKAASPSTPPDCSTGNRINLTYTDTRPTRSTA